jgi:hypothetical protein
MNEIAAEIRWSARSVSYTATRRVGDGADGKVDPGAGET